MNNQLQNIDIHHFGHRVYDLWDNDWLLLTVGDYQKKHYNTMTVAWGGFGNMWDLPIAMVVVRPSRYTYEFINTYSTFTLCGFPEDYKDALKVLGSTSGRDGDKIAASGLNICPSMHVQAPVFAEAHMIVECKKLYWDDFKPDHFLSPVIEKMYPSQDYHRMFFGEIIAVRGIAELFEIS